MWQEMTPDERAGWCWMRHKAGLSFTDIGRELKTTRNAVAGTLWRLQRRLWDMSFEQELIDKARERKRRLFPATYHNLLKVQEHEPEPEPDMVDEKPAPTKRQRLPPFRSPAVEIYGATHRKVIEAAARQFGITPYAILSAGRWKHWSKARHVCCYILRECYGRTYPQIGATLRKDHSSVIYACRKVAEMAKEDETFRGELNAVLIELGHDPV